MSRGIGLFSQEKTATVSQFRSSRLKQTLQLRQIAERILVVPPQSVEMERGYACLSSVDEIELPTVTYMDDLAWLHAHFLANLEVEVRGFQLLILRNRGKNSNKVGFDIAQQKM